MSELSKNTFKLPELNDAYLIEDGQYIEISLDSYSLEYSVIYPSGLIKEFTEERLLTLELMRYVKDSDKREDIIRYATNWRRIAFYPKTLQCNIIFPDGRVGMGGYGNHK